VRALTEMPIGPEATHVANNAVLASGSAEWDFYYARAVWIQNISGTLGCVTG